LKINREIFFMKGVTGEKGPRDVDLRLERDPELLLKGTAGTAEGGTGCFSLTGTSLIKAGEVRLSAGVSGLWRPDGDMKAVKRYGSFVPRGYQWENVRLFLEAVRNGEDRIVFRQPVQTGKSKLAGPLAKESKELFPGKRALVLVPTFATMRQMLRDLSESVPDLRVGVVDASRKELTGDHDIVAASVFTLAREKYLQELDPNDFGLVIIDEAHHAHASTWRKILSRLGFLDSDGNITRKEGSILVGLTANQFSLKAIFGEGSERRSGSLSWFMDVGYLHHLAGKDLTYEDKIEMEPVEEEGETLLIPKAGAAQSAAVVDLYAQYEKGNKVVIFTARTENARNHVAAFNKKFGDGFAEAYIGRLLPSQKDSILTRFESPDGPKVLIGIRGLSEGVRAKGVSAVLVDYQGTSFNLFGQRIGRPLGRDEGEEQRTIRGYVLGKKGSVGFVTFRRFMELMGRVPGFVTLPTVRIERRQARGDDPKPQRKRAYQLKRNPQTGFKFVIAEGPTHLSYTTGKFQSILMRLLVSVFKGNALDMSASFTTDIDTLNRMLYGELPATVDEVLRMEDALGVPDGQLVRAWEADAMEYIDYIYPIDPEKTTEAKRGLIEATRRISLYAIGLRPFQRFFDETDGLDQDDYLTWNDIFTGDSKSWQDRFTKITWSDLTGILLKINSRCGGRAFGEMELLEIIDRFHEEREASRFAKGVEYLDDFDPLLAEDLLVIDSFENGLPETPERYADTKKTLAMAIRYLQLLPFRNAAIFALRTFHDMTLEDVGKVAGITRDRSRQITDKIFAGLKNFLEVTAITPSLTGGILAGLRRDLLAGTRQKVLNEICAMAGGKYGQRFREALLGAVRAEAKSAVGSSKGFTVRKVVRVAVMSVYDRLRVGGSNAWPVRDNALPVDGSKSIDNPEIDPYAYVIENVTKDILGKLGIPWARSEKEDLSWD